MVWLNRVGNSIGELALYASERIHETVAREAGCVEPCFLGLEVDVSNELRKRIGAGTFCSTRCHVMQGREPQTSSVALVEKGELELLKLDDGKRRECSQGISMPRNTCTREESQGLSPTARANA